MMTNRYTNLYRIFFLLSDLIALNLVFLLLISRVVQGHDDGFKNYIVLSLLGNIAWLLSSYATACYIIYKDVNLTHLSKKTATSFLLFSAAIIAYTSFSEYQFSRVFIILLSIGFATYLLIGRLLLISYVLYTRTNSKFYTNIVVIGYNEVSRSLSTLIYASKNNIRIQGYFDLTYPAAPNQDYPYLGEINDCLDFAIHNNISEIYCTLSPEGSKELYDLAEEAEKHFIRFRFIPDLRNFINRKVHVDFIDHMPVLSLRSEPMEYETARLKKRAFDLIMSSFILVFLLSWLLPILAILIKLDSPGPVFFSQKRSGKNNKEFSCLKLRSLRAHNHADEACVQVTKNDDRTTKVGRFLRKTNLDELPQFINVILGQMSIVGARPHMLKHTLDFARIEDKYMVRHLSKPGVTGWAQVNGYRGEINQPGQLKNRLEHDIWYIENWNCWLDVKIVCLTVYMTVKGDKNAY